LASGAILAPARPYPHLVENRRTAMLIPLAPTTLAFAPGPEDLEESYFGAPEIAYAFIPLPHDDEESEQGEP
jgi:hypothetical protein